MAQLLLSRSERNASPGFPHRHRGHVVGAYEKAPKKKKKRSGFMSHWTGFDKAAFRGTHDQTTMNMTLCDWKNQIALSPAMFCCSQFNDKTAGFMAQWTENREIPSCHPTFLTHTAAVRRTHQHTQASCPNHSPTKAAEY